MSVQDRELLLRSMRKARAAQLRQPSQILVGFEAICRLSVGCLLFERKINSKKSKRRAREMFYCD